MTALSPTITWTRQRRLRRHAPHRAVAVLTAALAVGVLGTDVWLLSQRSRTTTVDLAEAVERFRQAPPPSSAPMRAADGPTAGAVEAPPVAAAVVDGETQMAPAASSTDGGVTPAVHPAAPAPTSTAAATARGATASSPPAEGVYAYRTTGGESISVAGATHRYPERTYGTVRHLEGCRWEIRNEVIEEHVDHRLLCNEADHVAQLQQTREVEFYGRRDGFTMTCDPPLALHRLSDVPGAVVTTTCGDGSTNAALTRTYLGREPLTIGSSTVEVHHIRIVGEFRGRANGTSDDELWLLDSGLTARWKRTVDTKADAAFGAQVRYQENADFVLESLDPAT